MKKNETFTASIYLGLRHGYSDVCHPIDDVYQWVQNFCNEFKLGVTFTKTEFIYVNGNEPGVVIGIINYPRFPRPIKVLKEISTAIAEGLMELCHQERISIVFSDETIMLERQEEIMPDKKEKSYLDYDFAEFLTQMAEATKILKKMNEAVTYMRWQYEMDDVMKEFEKEVDTANGWLSSWCG